MIVGVEDDGRGSLSCFHWERGDGQRREPNILGSDCQVYLQASSRGAEGGRWWLIAVVFHWRVSTSSAASRRTVAGGGSCEAVGGGNEPNILGSDCQVYLQRQVVRR